MLVEALFFPKTESNEFPFNLAFMHQDKLKFNQAVTFLVGENGSGKTTILELLNESLNLPRIGNSALRKQVENIKVSTLASLKYGLTKPKGFYLTAQDFSLYIYQNALEKKASYEELERVEKEYKDKSVFTQNQARSAFLNTIHSIDTQYERNLNQASHGESFLAVFKSRIREKQIYLLDEPETPLSFHNLLALMRLMHEATSKGCQFIIATHSPILLSYPNSTIYQLDESGIHESTYNDLEMVNLTKTFLQAPERFLKTLFEEE